MAIAVTNLGSRSQGGQADVAVGLSQGVPAHSVIVLVVYDGGSTGWGNAADGVNTYFQSGSTSVAVNGVAANGSLNVSFTWDCKAVPASIADFPSNIVYTPASDHGAILSAFYVTNAAQSAVSTTATATGNSGLPSATLAGVPAANSLVIGALATLGLTPPDTFTQDVTVAYAAPPELRSYTNQYATFGTVAGGTVLSSEQLTYAPSITSEAWAEVIASLAPRVDATLPLAGVAATGAVGALTCLSWAEKDEDGPSDAPRQQYLAFRERQFRERQGQKPALAPRPTARGAAPPPAKPAPSANRVLSDPISAWRQQRALAQLPEHLALLRRTLKPQAR